mmetsp:Transcript_50421/g.100620  ORF Transcript_50421/g.100620 Transcript_50421/m.100620 type:complete len:81 (-) Transcript_50421:459-701(-)
MASSVDASHLLVRLSGPPLDIADAMTLQVREADQAMADGAGATARGGNRIPHASVFGTYRHLKEEDSANVQAVVRDTINY